MVESELSWLLPTGCNYATFNHSQILHPNGRSVACEEVIDKLRKVRSASVPSVRCDALQRNRPRLEVRARLGGSWWSPQDCGTEIPVIPTVPRTMHALLNPCPMAVASCGEDRGMMTSGPYLEWEHTQDCLSVFWRRSGLLEYHALKGIHVGRYL